MTLSLTPKPITAAAFAAYGDLLTLKAIPDLLINEGMCGRHHDLAKLDFAGGSGGISLFDANLRSFPHAVTLVERHPLGSQAFIPMSLTSFLVVVADDEDGTPNNLQAFLTAPGQAINLHRGVWHGVLAPLESPGLFAVVDRIGSEKNLEEFWFDEPYTVIEP
ncbi:MAG: ureidoglycolate lyase [Paracoccaceae bacterium]|jgi:ureidoglycolate lyase